MSMVIFIKYQQRPIIKTRWLTTLIHRIQCHIVMSRSLCYLSTLIKIRIYVVLTSTLSQIKMVLCWSMEMFHAASCWI